MSLQKVVVHCKSMLDFGWLAHWNGQLLTMDENQSALLYPISLQDDLLWDSSTQTPEQTKVLSWSPVLHLFPLMSGSHTPQPHGYCCPQPSHPSSVFPSPQVEGPAEYLVPYQEVVINALQKPCGLLVLSIQHALGCLLDSHKDLGQWPQDFFQICEVSFLKFLTVYRRHPQHHPTCWCALSITALQALSWLSSLPKQSSNHSNL